MRFARGFRVAAVAALLPHAGIAQSTIPVRQVRLIGVSDSGAIGGLLGVRQLADGRILANDGTNFRVVIYDSTLKRETPLLANEGAPSRYGSMQGVFISYVADTTAFYDQQAQAFVLIDPLGNVGRSIAMPRPQDRLAYIGSWNSGQGYDPRGRFVYRTIRSATPGADPLVPRDSGVRVITAQQDSSAIVRLNTNGDVDTVALVARAFSKTIRETLGGGGFRSTFAANPLPLVDEWTRLPDGTVAVVRGIDYHIDWYSPDGTKSSGPKMPFDWRRVTDDEKRAMIDSARKAYDTRIANAPTTPQRGIGGIMRPPTAPLPFMALEPHEMPDYYPPLRAGTVRADREGNVWILPTTSHLSASGLAYDVINRQGEIIERVVIPTGRNIAAFGRDGVLVLTSSYGPGAPRLEVVRVVR